MVVDALDLCYTKGHVDTFVIISGDSDFSPLVSKLRENNKEVIGVGVKHSTSDLLVGNCDDFIYYDDLVRDKAQKRGPRKKAGANASRGKKAVKVTSEPETAEPEAADDASRKGIDVVVSTFEALVAERGGEEKIWGSMIKQALKRRNPGFNESYHGYKSFNGLLEDAQARGLFSLERDEKSGGYIVRAPNAE